jgi:HNH endonuclease
MADAVGLDMNAFSREIAPAIVPTRSPLTLSLSPRCGERRRTRTAASAATTCALAATNRWQRPGLEAAHIKWFQARGPDVVQNGLALCSLHHKIFDLGAFTVLPESHQIVFRRHLHVIGRRRHQGEAARPSRRGTDSAAREGVLAASRVSGLAQGGSVQGAGAGVAAAECHGPLNGIAF